MIWRSTTTQNVVLAPERTGAGSGDQLREKVELQPAGGIRWHLKPTKNSGDQSLLCRPISILSLASALTPTHVCRSQPREAARLEANPTKEKRKKKNKETKKLFSQICSKEQFTEGSDKRQCQHSTEGGNNRARANRGEDKAAQTYINSSCDGPRTGASLTA